MGGGWLGDLVGILIRYMIDTVWPMRERRAHAAEDREWDRRTGALDAVKKTYDKTIRLSSGDSAPAYNSIFGPDLCEKIRWHLIDLSQNRSIWRPRPMNKDQLRDPAVQRTIDEVLAKVKSFKEADPESAKQ